MKISAGQTVLITGAPAGLGTHITEAFAERGVKLGLVAYPGAIAFFAQVAEAQKQKPSESATSAK